MMTPSTDPTTTVLVTLTGRDRPGLTSELFTVLAHHSTHVLDVEQVTIRGRLLLATLLAQPADESSLRRDLGALARRLHVEIEISTGHGDHHRAPGRAHVTMLGYPLHPEDIEAFARTTANANANIDRIVRLASYPVTSIEFEVSGADPDQLKTELAQVAFSHRVDLAVQPSGLLRRAKRLVVMDVDSTLIQGEVIEMLAERAGVLDQVAKITADAMAGELDFAESLRARVSMLAGLPVSAVDEVREKVSLAAGARTLIRTLKRLDYQCAIVSGGFSYITDPLAEELGIDFAAANTLEIVNGRLTGRLVGPILDRAGKADALREFAEMAKVPLAQTVAVGDGANDLDMIRTAGLGIAFNAKAVVQDAADTSVNVPYLDAVLYLLGINRTDIEAADS